MDCSRPGLPVHHQLPEFTQTHVHRVGDAIQPSHPLSSPSPPAPNPSQHHGLFQWWLISWGGQSIGVSASASVLPMNTQDWSPLGWTGWISLQSKGLSGAFSNTTVQKHQFFGAQLSWYLFIYLAVPGLRCGIQDLFSRFLQANSQLLHVVPNPMTKDRTWARCLGNTES